MPTKASAGRVLTADCDETRIGTSDTPIDIPELIQKLIEEFAGKVGELGLRYGLAHLDSESLRTLG